jgi:hypothetical protein
MFTSYSVSSLTSIHPRLPLWLREPNFGGDFIALALQQFYLL